MHNIIIRFSSFFFAVVIFLEIPNGTYAVQHCSLINMSSYYFGRILKGTTITVGYRYNALSTNRRAKTLRTYALAFIMVTIILHYNAVFNTNFRPEPKMTDNNNE